MARFRVDGLKSRRSPGRAPSSTAPRKAQLLDLVLAGPDPEVHGVARWRCVDLRADAACFSFSCFSDCDEHATSKFRAWSMLSWSRRCEGRRSSRPTIP